MNDIGLQRLAVQSKTYGGNQNAVVVRAFRRISWNGLGPDLRRRGSTAAAQLSSSHTGQMAAGSPSTAFFFHAAMTQVQAVLSGQAYVHINLGELFHLALLIRAACSAARPITVRV